MLETLTIRECLHYATLLRFPECSMSCADKSALVEAVIAETSLIAYATCRLSTVTVAERKRLSIAIQLLTKPRLVFVDEPNFGLDRLLACLDPHMHACPAQPGDASIHAFCTYLFLRVR